MEVTNRLKRLDLIDRVPEGLWMQVCNTVQKAVIKTTPKKKKCKKAIWLSEEALQIAEKREAKYQEAYNRRLPVCCFGSVRILWSLLIPEYSGFNRKGTPFLGLRNPGISFVGFSIR